MKVPTIRYYEEIGLLGRADRTGSNRRSFGPEDLRRLRFIRHARDLGFGIDAIRDLIALSGDPARPCAGADAIARTHLADIETRIARLTALRTEIARMLAECPQEAIGGCRVIEVLGDHGLCAADHRHDPAPSQAPS